MFTKENIAETPWQNKQCHAMIYNVAWSNNAAFLSREFKA